MVSDASLVSDGRENYPMEYGIATVFSQNRGEKVEKWSFDGRSSWDMRLIGLCTQLSDEREPAHGQADTEYRTLDRWLVGDPYLGGLSGRRFFGRKLDDSF